MVHPDIRSLRRGAPWLVALFSLTFAGVLLHWHAQDRLQIAALKVHLATAAAGVRRSNAADSLHTASRGDLAHALAVETSQAFAGSDVRDHLDGRRDDPGFALVWHRQQQRIIERQYGYAIASLHLPPSSAAELRELLTARREAAVDGRDAAIQVGLAGPQVNLAVEQSLDAFTDQIKQLVGLDVYYGQLELAPTISACKALLDNTVGVDLAAKDEPLTNDQMYSLAHDYVDAAYGPAASSQPQATDPGSTLTPQYQALLDHVSSGVSPSQASSIRDFLVEQVETLKVSGTPPQAGQRQD
jgi:hypothetical protein